jgi:hypothetical protein
MRMGAAARSCGKGLGGSWWMEEATEEEEHARMKVRQQRLSCGRWSR